MDGEMSEKRERRGEKRGLQDKEEGKRVREGHWTGAVGGVDMAMVCGLFIHIYSLTTHSLTHSHSHTAALIKAHTHKSGRSSLLFLLVHNYVRGQWG